MSDYRRKPYVTATEYGVSQTSGTDITGVLLNVYKCSSVPPFAIEFAVKEMPFPNGEAADAYCLANGWIKEYVHKV